MSGKAKRFGAPTDHQNQMSRLLTDSSLDDVGTTESIAIELIDRDPEQPRKFAVTAEQLRNRTPPTDRDALAQYEDLVDFAANIEEMGLIQPIGLYRHGDRFRLSWGERRLLAHIYLGKPSIRANISRTAPTRRLYRQIAENLGRKDLSLKEKVSALARAMEQEPVKDAAELARCCGLERSQTFEYWAILRDKQVTDLVLAGKVTSVELAARATREKDPLARAAMLGLEANPEVEPNQSLPPRKIERRGRPASSIKLEIKGGNASAVARELCHRLIGKDVFEKQFAGVSFDDLSALNDVVRQVLNQFAAKLAKGSKP